jgi:putative transposase
MSERSLSLCVSKEIANDIEVFSAITSSVGIDRNLRNLAVGNDELVTFYDLSYLQNIADRTRNVVGSFKRDDVRVRQEIASKYGRRRKERTRQILHRVSRDVVESAKANHQVIVLEDISGIRRLYRKGNGQGREFSRMNTWPFHEIKKQIEYKAAWEGVPVIVLTRGETRGTTTDCPRCGERLQVPVRGDGKHRRQLWCQGCRRWRDRDVCAVMNISQRGWVRFAHSTSKEEGGVGEAVKGNAEHGREPLILRVDASKSAKRLVKTKT